MKLQATYTRDDSGMHCVLSDIETQEIVHSITAERMPVAHAARFAKEVTNWAARNEHVIVEQCAADAPLSASPNLRVSLSSYRGDACHE